MTVIERFACPRCNGRGYTLGGEDCIICGHAGTGQLLADALAENA
jgi:hypothetical protein